MMTLEKAKEILVKAKKDINSVSFKELQEAIRIISSLKPRE